MTRPSVGSRRLPPDPGELRRLAARRRALGDRLRHLLPGVIVGSATLVGTGGLAAWVSSQPGVNATSGSATGRSVPAVPPTTDPVRALQRALLADEATLRSLEAGIPTVSAPVVADPVKIPVVDPLPQIAVPPAPPAVSAPAVNATTGASHAIP